MSPPPGPAAMRAPLVLGLVLLVAPLPFVAALAPAPAEPPALADVVDQDWLTTTHDALAARYGGAFLDVGYKTTPALHVAALFAGPVPADLGALHPALPTVGYDTSGWAPVSHDFYVPYMLLLAQQVPTGIRPGSWMSAPSACTMAHVVADATGALYILTAGHCVDAVGQRVALVTEGDIGHVVAFRNAGVGQDYALVRIDPQHYGEINPSMVGWGGPVGMATAPETGLARQYGWGYLTWMAGHASRCRAGLTEVDFWGAASWSYLGQVSSGDSGSGVNAPGGGAMGILTHGGGIVIANQVIGTRADYALQRLEAATGLDLHIVDGAPMLPACNVVTG